MRSLFTDFKSWSLLLWNSVWNWFQILYKLDRISSPKGIFWNSASRRYCWVGSNDAASFELWAFHDDWSETNVYMIINDGRSDVNWVFDIDVVANVDWKGKGFFRGPVNSFKNGVITDFSILSDPDGVIDTLSYTSEAKIRIFCNVDSPNDGGIRSDISGVRNDRL